MAYDYSSANNRLELPNPYRIENKFLFACSAALLLGGLTALLWSRTGLQAISFKGVVPLIVGIGLLASGLAFAVIGARRLRFFFGRGRPSSLAPEVGIGAAGNSNFADYYKHMLRQGGIEYPEPKGALNGVLYHLVPQLITAPNVVQELAQRHFFNALSFLVTLASFIFAWAFFGTEETRPLMSIVYLLFSSFVLLKPLLSGSQVRMNTTSLLLLAVAGVVGPVLAGLIGKSLPSIQFSLHGQTFFMLLAALIAVSLILLAVFAQIDGAPQTERSCEQMTVSMNGPPGAMLTELDRRLQEEWDEKIPNRRYTRQDPVTQGTEGGQFAGELFEETQPMPIGGMTASTLAGALNTPRHRWLIVLDIYGTLTVLAGVAFALTYVRSFDSTQFLESGLNSQAPIGYSVICFMVAAFCFKSASAIWGRFNFESVLIWVEMLGSWQSSRIGTGNQLSSNMQSESDVVRVESMTLRVWRARIESVVFGKDSARQVTSMYSTSAEARQLAEGLTDFAGQQSVFIAPNANEDLRRLGFLHSSEALLAGGAQPSALLTSVASANVALPIATASGGSSRFCTGCGTPAPVTATVKFCGDCGLGLGDI